MATQIASHLETSRAESFEFGEVVRVNRYPQPMRTPLSGMAVWGSTAYFPRHNTHAPFEECVKGSIEAGKSADMVVPGAEPTAKYPLRIKDITSDKTIAGGRAACNP